MANKNYTMIPGDFWNRKLTKQILASGPEAMTLALYLMSCHHATFLGVYSLPLAYAVQDTKMTLAQVETAMAALVTLGFAAYDGNAEMVWVVESAGISLGELKGNDKNVIKAQREFEGLAECTMLKEFHAKYAKALHLNPFKGAVAGLVVAEASVASSKPLASPSGAPSKHINRDVDGEAPKAEAPKAEPPKYAPRLRRQRAKPARKRLPSQTVAHTLRLCQSAMPWTSSLTTLRQQNLHGKQLGTGSFEHVTPTAATTTKLP